MKRRRGPHTVGLAVLVWFGVAAVWAAPAKVAEPRRIMPDDLVYKGAFRLPDGPDEYAWGWSGQAMAYCPTGDPKGEDDGYGGSLFGTGHNWNQWVSEINIPKPVISPTKDLKSLPVAKTLQEFANIRGDLLAGEMEQPRAGLAFLPAQGGQRSDKLYFCFGPHMHENSTDPSYGWCETDLSRPRPAGPWRIDNKVTYVTTDYLFVIPKVWADKHVGGLRLATGRFRDGGQGSQGPTLIAIAPWRDGNPPKSGARLTAKVLLRYSSVMAEKQTRLKDYHHADAWTGGAWMAAGDRSAVVFVGTKGKGKCWYGFANGVVWPEEGPWPPVPAAPNDQRGWWSSRFAGEFVFYDPADLAAVAAGKKKPDELQPYATMNVDKVLYSKVKRAQERLGAASFDPQRGYLYVFEPRADGDKSIVHVWRIRSKETRKSHLKQGPLAVRRD